MGDELGHQRIADMAALARGKPAVKAERVDLDDVGTTRRHIRAQMRKDAVQQMGTHGLEQARRAQVAAIRPGQDEIVGAGIVEWSISYLPARTGTSI
jgi:predicted transcriptional regulator